MTMHIGTYDKAGGRGLVPMVLSDQGVLTPGEPYAGTRNASFGARHGDLAYLVDEQDTGAIGVHRWTGAQWQPVARRRSEGALPCFVALDPEGRRLAAANYGSGSVALWALDDFGIPDGGPAVFQHQGHGPDAGRQEGPHMHCVRFADGRLLMVDLGTDSVLQTRIVDDGFGAVEMAWAAPAGSGPRHVVPFGSGRAVVICELAATLTLLAQSGENFVERCTVPTAPADFTGENAGGHLAVNAAGTRAYASNRGHDSIAVFAIHRDWLELLQHVPSGGADPRHFALLEARGRLVVAHEGNGRVTAFAVAADGTISAAGAGVTVPGACFVLA